MVSLHEKTDLMARFATVVNTGVIERTMPMPMPLTAEELFRRLETYKAHDISWRAGKILTGIYDPGHATETVVKAAYSRFLTENVLFSQFAATGKRGCAGSCLGEVECV